MKVFKRFGVLSLHTEAVAIVFSFYRQRLSVVTYLDIPKLTFPVETSTNTTFAVYANIDHFVPVWLRIATAEYRTYAQTQAIVGPNVMLSLIITTSLFSFQ